MEEIKTVELTISQLINDLNTGLSWYEKDNIGRGSIQTKYDATEMQIHVMKQHPKLANIEQVRVCFTLRDDTVVPTPEEVKPEQNFPLKNSILRSEPLKDIEESEGMNSTYIQ